MLNFGTKKGARDDDSWEELELSADFFPDTNASRDTSFIADPANNLFHTDSHFDFHPCVESEKEMKKIFALSSVCVRLSLHVC